MLWALEARTLYSNFWNLTYQHLFWGMTYWSCLFYEHFIFIKGWLSPGRPFPHSAELEVIFLKRVSLLEQRTHITHKKLLEETWDWLWSGHNSNANAFHQWFALDAKFWGKRRTKTTDHLLFSTNQQNANSRTNTLFSNKCYWETCRKHCNAQSIIIERHYQWYPY